MKRTIALILALILTACLMSGCNKQVFDMNYKFTYAVIDMLDGTTVKGTVESWRDFDDGDQLQLTIDGVTYLTHSANVILMSKKP